MTTRPIVGAREEGESDLQPPAREVTEELGVTVRLDSVSLVGSCLAFRDGRDDQLTYIAYPAEYDGTIAPHNEVETSLVHRHAVKARA